MSRVSELMPEQLDAEIKKRTKLPSDPQMQTALKSLLLERERRQIIAFSDDRLAFAIARYREKARAGSHGAERVLERLTREQARRQRTDTSATTPIGLTVPADQRRPLIVRCPEPCSLGTTNGAVARPRVNGRPEAVLPTFASNRATKMGESDSRYRGVGGWLLFWCIGLTILGPLLTAAMFIVRVRQDSQYFHRYPGLQGVLVLDGLLSAAVLSFGVYAGIALWTMKRNAVGIARAYLVVMLVSSAVSYLALPFLVGLPAEATGAILSDGFRAMAGPYIGFSIWSSYLKKSKRIRATFPGP